MSLKWTIIIFILRGRFKFVFVRNGHFLIEFFVSGETSKSYKDITVSETRMIIENAAESGSIMTVKTRAIQADKVTELYLTVTPSPSFHWQTELEGIFCAVAETLKANSARILQERIFGSAEVFARASSIRPPIYGELDDGVSPTWLVCPEGVNGGLSGVQIHAISGCNRLDILKADNKSCGRIARMPDLSYLTLSGVRQSEMPGRVNQARAMFEKAASVLNQAGIDFLAVPRTWIWLENILGWYGDFNLVRNTFYKEKGIIAQKGHHRMPASTGIGIRTENGAFCAMELAAVWGGEAEIQYMNAGGNQESAFEYGSAFSRACKARTLAGYTFYISGTASIGADGKTTHPDDPRGQIEATIDNVRAVLRECGCGDEDVVQAIAYSKTPEIDRMFAKDRNELNWPIVPVIADICRDNLLFEIEVTAAKNR